MMILLTRRAWLLLLIFGLFAAGFWVVHSLMATPTMSQNIPTPALTPPIYILVTAAALLSVYAAHEAGPRRRRETGGLAVDRSHGRSRLWCPSGGA